MIVKVAGVTSDELQSLLELSLPRERLDPRIEFVVTERTDESAIARTTLKDASATVERLVSALCNAPGATPTADELWISVAHTVSVRSSSLHLRVGAVAVGGDSVLAVGCNEVPLTGGRQPWPDREDRARDFHSIDHDGVSRRELALEGLADLVEPEQYSSLLGVIDVERAVHAEVAVVADAARRGVPLEGSTFYVTHEPCYRCCRVLLAAGVSKAVFDIPRESHLSERLADELTTSLPVLQATGIRWSVMNATRMLS